jgi:hypothetical protein
MKLTKVSGAGVAMAAATVVLATGALTPTASEASHKIHCMGANACKGHGSCKTAANACKGKNACKGQGWVKLSKAKCKAVGGTFEKG